MSNEIYQAQPGAPRGNNNNCLIIGIVLAGVGFCFLTFGGIMIALLLPAVQAAREAARRMQCMNHEKQIVLALHNYHDANGSLPPAYTVDAEGEPLHSWRVLLLPYIEQTALYEQIRLDEPWDSEYNSQFHSMVISTYTCPSWPDHLTPYQFVVGPDCISDGPGSVKFSDFDKGLSNTIVLLESCNPVCWMEPSDIAYEDLDYGIAQRIKQPGSSDVGSYHTGGVNAGFADGSVQFISNSISPEELKEKCTIRNESHDMFSE